MPAIEIRGLRVDRGGQPVLHGIDLDIEAGVLTGLLGPSGCGKTTLMRSIVGVQTLRAGSATVLGRSAGAPELRSMVGYVTQAPSVYLDLSVVENLRYFAAVTATPPSRVQEVLEAVELEGSAERVVGQLSGGQHARASLATALLPRPTVLVLDEPTVGLDPVLRRDLWAHFRQLAQEGVTLLVSSHVMDEAKECDQLILMRDGGILAVASPDELRRRTGEQDLSAAFLRLIEST